MSQRFSKLFPLFLIAIALVGISLRLVDYDRLPPFGETSDEFMYPFAGLSLLKTGIPASWSDFGAYPTGQILNLWGGRFRIVSPWLEKPPLYVLLTGSWMLVNNMAEFSQVRLSTLRLIPIVLSFWTIVMVGLLAKEIFNRKVDLVAALLYSTIPIMVIGNRLSLTENLLVPISLTAIWLYYIYQQQKQLVLVYLMAALCGLSLLTKQIGLVLAVSLIYLFLSQKHWRQAVLIGLISIPFALVNPLMGYFTNWQLYQNVLQEFNNAHKLGLPEMLFTLFRFPGIGHKESLFLDGGFLAGLLLLLTSPFWLTTHLDQKRYIPLLSYPFIYLTTLTLLEGGTTWYGWHVFPLYPFAAILLAHALVNLWQQPQFLQFLFFLVTLASSSIRFILMINPNLHNNWQMPLITLLATSFIIWIFPKIKARQTLLLLLFLLFIAVNIYTVVNLKLIYPVRPQPLL